MDQLRIEHMRVLDALNVTDSSGKLMDLDDPRIPELIKKGWSLAGAYAAQYLEYNPEPSKPNLKLIFAGFAPPPTQAKSKYGNYLEHSDYFFIGSAFRIAPSVYVVEASYGVEFRTGTFMIVARNREGHFQELWNIKDLAARHYAQRDEIGRWMHLVRRAYYNGPLSAQRILPVFPAANGHPRFLVDAVQDADGGTILKQLSIWEWNGIEAKPLLVELYQESLDFAGFHFDGRTLRIDTKEELETLFSCGMCSEPRGVWAVRITPGGVQNLGHRFLKPEYQWADDLLTRFAKGSDISNLASHRVREALKAKAKEDGAEDAQPDTSSPDSNDVSWGMLSGCRVLRRGQHGSFILVVDEGKLHFTYKLHNGRPYFTDVEIH